MFYLKHIVTFICTLANTQKAEKRNMLQRNYFYLKNVPQFLETILSWGVFYNYSL